MEKAGLINLPIISFVHILKYLDLIDIGNLIKTCKHFHKLIYSDQLQSFWKGMCRKYRKYRIPESNHKNIKWIEYYKNSTKWNKFKYMKIPKKSITQRLCRFS